MDSRVLKLKICSDYKKRWQTSMVNMDSVSCPTLRFWAEAEDYDDECLKFTVAAYAQC